MDKDEIKLSDLQRIFVGDVPPTFYIELLLRAVIVYLVITFAMRLMGKRLAANLSRSELAALATLAAGMGAVLTTPDRGLVPALLIVAVLVILQWIINRKDVKNRKLEKVIQGERSVLVVDGVLQTKQMLTTRISKERVFEELRNGKVEQLGVVQRLYLEADGSFSMVKYEKSQPGLTVIPAFDKEFLSEQNQTDQMVCNLCGNKRKDHEDVCAECRASDWTYAVS
ncbi:MAG TPA: YetF domain-containing protein [Chitinophagaceae bacterium]